MNKKQITKCYKKDKNNNKTKTNYVVLSFFVGECVCTDKYVRLTEQCYFENQMTLAKVSPLFNGNQSFLHHRGLTPKNCL